jgi:hypothetical protein
MLVAGRERPYPQTFFNARSSDPSATGEVDVAAYVSAYAAPGAMRAGFELRLRCSCLAAMHDATSW